MAQKTNHLASSLSPYLLQHQYNPVDWYPWGKEALQRALQEDKPIFLSVGYSACHWCHVMERESFEDEQIAKLLNENFINIKVDREELPNVDRIYMPCVQAMTGRGGWPMSVFMTPDLKAFFSGTYFPPASRYGMPGFSDLLLKIIQAWKYQRSDLVSFSEKVFLSLSQEELAEQELRGPLSKKLLERLVADCQKDCDSQWGGFSKAPKFPQTGLLFALMRQYHHKPSKETLEMVTNTLEQMAKGGIYDQLGGGFHRYSVDERWMTPHFEKMLYDNALLSRLYLDAYQLTKQKEFLNIGLQTLQYLLREMRHPLGGFYSAEDADSEGEEGKFYLWSLSEIEENLQDPDLFCRTYGVTKEGGFESQNILHQVEPVWSLPSPEQDKLAADRETLLKVRNRRIRPGLDDKILVDWNGLAISSLSKAYQVTGQSLYLEAAQKTAQFIENYMLKDGLLHHLWRGTLGSTLGFLEDYANYILALLDLYECDFNHMWLKKAKNTLEKLVDLFWDQKSGAFYSTSSHHGSALELRKAFSDNATPAGNAQAAIALLRLSSYYKSIEYEKMAEKILSTHALAMQKSPKWYGTLLCAADNYLSSMQEITLLGGLKNEKIQELLHVIYSEYLPHKVLLMYDEQTKDLPMSNGKLLSEGHALVCYQGRCFPGASSPSQLRSLLAQKH